MGKVLSVVQRQVLKFNAENRAHRIISRDKPIPAPKHERTIDEIERIMTEHPAFLEKQHRKDVDLDERLKQVFVRANERKDSAALESTRPLPQKHKQVNDPEYGYLYPEVIPQGRFTLRQAVKFIGDHQADPTAYTAAAIAKEYKLSEDKTEMILLHFKAFQMFMPEAQKAKLSSEKAWIRQLTPGKGPENEENK